jgi:hypothetical protein
MHAVFTQATLHDVDEAGTYLREQAIPRIKQAPGFVGAQWVRLDDNTGRGMVTFESEQAAQAAAEQLRSNPPPADAVTVESVEVGVVVERV